MAERELHEWEQLFSSITEIDRVRHAPPSHVWDNIAARASAPQTANDSPSDSTYADPSDHQTDVVDLGLSRSRRAPTSARQQRYKLAMGGAAAVLAFIVGFSLLSNGPADDTTTFIASVTNADLPEQFNGTATATVALDDLPELEISFEQDLPYDEPVELWLIKPDLSDMRSLGVVQPGDTSWIWPADLDPNEYSLVDLSIEPDDGDPTHSGRSILRGQLTLR